MVADWNIENELHCHTNTVTFLPQHPPPPPAPSIDTHTQPDNDTFGLFLEDHP